MISNIMRKIPKLNLRQRYENISNPLNGISSLFPGLRLNIPQTSFSSLQPRPLKLKT